MVPFPFFGEEIICQKMENNGNILIFQNSQAATSAKTKLHKPITRNIPNTFSIIITKENRNAVDIHGSLNTATENEKEIPSTAQLGKTSQLQYLRIYKQNEKL